MITMYHYTNGGSTPIEVDCVGEEDSNFINENNLIVSSEILSTGVIAVYLRDESDYDGENELIELIFDRNNVNFEDVISNLINEYKARKEGEHV